MIRKVNLEKHKVLIIIVNYNSYSDTKECVLSIKENEESLPFIIIVDNNSKDADKLDDLKEVYDNLKIIKNSSNVGFGRANNVGIKWAFKNLDFEYLLLLNNDTIIGNKSIFKLIEPFNKGDQIGVTTSKIMYCHDREMVWYGGGDINYKRGWPKITDFNNKPTKEGANNARNVSFVSGCVMMFSRKCIEEVKGFDKDFFMYCEDLELSMRLAKNGYKLWYEASSVIYHKVQGSTNKENRITGIDPKNPNLPFLFYHMKSNQWIAMKKHLDISKFLIFNTIYWMELIYTSLKLIFKGRIDMIETLFKTSKRILKFI